MRLLVTTTAGTGHLHPLVPLARAAMAAGHEVAVAAPESLGPTVAALGLPLRALPDYTAAHLAHVEQVMRSLGPPGPGAEVAMFREVFGWAKTDSTLVAVRRLVADWRPDVVLHEGGELSGALAAEEAGVAHGTVAICLRGTLVGVAPHAAEGTAELATSLGLPTDLAADRVLGVPYVSMAPPSLDPVDAPRPARVLRHRPAPVHAATEVSVPSGAGPLVYVTMGTEAWGIPGMGDRVAALLQATATSLPHVRFLLTTGAGDVRLPTMPATVTVAGYLPQEQVLDRCDAVVSHGGFNTTMATLAHGRPTVLMPLFSTDQFDTSAAVATTGAALELRSPTPALLAAAVEQALTDPAMRAAAEAVATEMAALPPPGEVVEALTPSRRPRPAARPAAPAT